MGASYSRNGLNSPQPGLALHQHALAHGDAAEAGAQRDREDPRSAIERQLSAARSRSGLPLGSSGISSTRTSWLRRPRPRATRRSRSSRSASSPSSPTTKATTRSPHSSSGTPSTSTRARPGCSRIRAATAGAGTFTPPLMITSSARPVTRSRPSSSIWPRSSVPSQPSLQRRRGPLGVALVAVEQHRPAQQHLARRRCGPRRRRAAGRRTRSRRRSRSSRRSARPGSRVPRPRPRTSGSRRPAADEHGVEGGPAPRRRRAVLEQRGAAASAPGET